MHKQLNPQPDETLDSIKDIQLFQSQNGYRFSVDAILLEHFISLDRPGKGIELGTGSGIISILLAKKHAHIKKIFAVELQRSLADRAARNIELNGVADKVELISNNIKQLQNIFPAHTFDFVFSNPPFRKPKTGRMSIDQERAVARHELEITLADLIKTAAHLLKHSGKFYLIYHPFRLAELISLLRESTLEPKCIRFVHPRAGEDAKMVLIKAIKGSGTWLTIESPLYVHNKKNEYTAEMKQILK